MATNNAINLGQEGFFAYVDVTLENVTGNDTSYTVLFDTLRSGEGYDPATGIWTCPKSGIYLVGASIQLQNCVVGHTKCQITVDIIGGLNYQIMSLNPYAIRETVYNSTVVPGSCVPMPITIGDQLRTRVTVSNSTKTVDIVGYAAGANVMASYFWAQRFTVA